LYSAGPSRVEAVSGLFGCQHCLGGLYEQMQKARYSQLGAENEMRFLLFLSYFLINISN
jgi:hypothetical protein